MNWKVAGMAGTAIVTLVLTGVSAVAGANKFTGNVSLAVGQSFEDDDFSDNAFDDSFPSISGEANVNVAFANNINLQLNFAGVASFVDTDPWDSSLDRDAGFQGSTHIYIRNDTYALGAFGGVGIASPKESSSPEYYFVGAEGQYYWKNFTFGVNGGYLDSDSDVNFWGTSNEFLSDAWFTNAEVRWYATPKVTVTANVGYISGETFDGDFDQDTLHWGAKAEYWPEEKEPLSLWVAYEGRNTDFSDNTPWPVDANKEVHTVKIGLTIHFGVEGTKQDNDRNGPAFNTQDYGAVVVGG